MITTPRSSVSTWVWPRPWSLASMFTSWASMTTLHTSTCHLITSRSGVSASTYTINYCWLSTNYHFGLSRNIQMTLLDISFQLYQVRHDKYQHLYLSQKKVRLAKLVWIQQAGRYITIMWELGIGNAIDVAFHLKEFQTFNNFKFLLSLPS